MTLDDVLSVFREINPGFEPTVRGAPDGLYIATPTEPVKIERRRVKDCTTMEELRAYVDSVKPV